MNSLFSGSGQTLNLFAQDNAVFANSAFGKPTTISDPCAHVPVLSEFGSLHAGNYMQPSDPIEVDAANIKGSYSLHYDDQWLYSAGQYTNEFWVPALECMLFEKYTA